MNHRLRAQKPREGFVVCVAQSADAEQFNFENQCGVRRNRAWITVASVGQFWWDGKLDLVADFHLGHTKIPPGDDLPRAKDERERLVAIHGTVKLFAVKK